MKIALQSQRNGYGIAQVVLANVADSPPRKHTDFFKTLQIV